MKNMETDTDTETLFYVELFRNTNISSEELVFRQTKVKKKTKVKDKQKAVQGQTDIETVQGITIHRKHKINKTANMH